MKTTKQWWDEVSNCEEKMINWLKSQYHGEVTAEKRIRDMLVNFPNINKKCVRIINKIADDEAQHALWVKGLLDTRGIKAEVLDKEERYWNETIPRSLEVNTFEYACAVAHLAEVMRLERIELLSSDERFKDIADVFKKILPDEMFHAKAFGEMSTIEDIEAAREFHNIGMNAIGLVP